jgi:hypothetical protein
MITTLNVAGGLRSPDGISRDNKRDCIDSISKDGEAAFTCLLSSMPTGATSLLDLPGGPEEKLKTSSLPQRILVGKKTEETSDSFWTE